MHLEKYDEWWILKLFTILGKSLCERPYNMYDERLNVGKPKPLAY